MIARQIGSLLGDHTLVGEDSDGTPRVAPRTDDACSIVLSKAAKEGWRVRVQGTGSWNTTDAPADLALSTSNLTGVTEVSPADLVASVRAGTPWEELRLSLLDHEAWIPLDPPGAARSVGSVVATGTAGPLRSGFGTLRDQILGLTFVTGDGRIIRAGGKVVKNVAGYDIAKLLAGSFGAFGVITSVNFRLRTVPRADQTLFAAGDRDALIRAARAILGSGETPAALELISPRAGGADEWTLALRLRGSEPAVAAQTTVAADVAAPAILRRAELKSASGFWKQLCAGATGGETTLRMGALPSALESTLDLLAHHLDEKCDDWITVSVTTGSVRWTGNATPDHIRLFRGMCAQQEVPITLERAPWRIRSEVGHFGAYRGRVDTIVESIRGAFDPAQVLLVPLSAGQ
jgi:FAD/FMN-containing dehydrogenase